ncbi:MAG: hypothetical protein ACKOTF_18335 [Opitutaceae bacterium]
MGVNLALALVVLVSSGLASAARAAESPVLSRLLHHNPGLLTDLGVGLWAWPLPMDFDEDGRMDLVVD